MQAFLCVLYYYIVEYLIVLCSNASLTVPIGLFDCSIREYDLLIQTHVVYDEILRLCPSLF